MPRDVEITTRIYLDSLNPIHLFVRGNDLDTSPDYYALRISRGYLDANIVKVANGTPTTLATTITSDTYISSQWVNVTVQATRNGRIQAAIQQESTGNWLDQNGELKPYKTYAFDLIDQSSPYSTAGYVGIARPAQYADTLKFDDFTVGFPNSVQDFETLPDGNAYSTGKLPNLPANESWDEYSSGGSARFVVSRARASGGEQSLLSTTHLSTGSARAWFELQQPDDVRVGADIFLSSPQPIQVFTRGSNLDGASPNYYAAQIIRGVEVKLFKVVSGTATQLGSTLTSSSYLSGDWVRMTLETTGSDVRVEVYRPSTGLYLNDSGNWQSAPDWAIETTDGSIAGGGTSFVGLSRPASTADSVAIDRFEALPASTAPYVDTQVPNVSSISKNTNGSVVTITPTISDDIFVSKVEYYVDNRLAKTQYFGETWAWDFDTRTVADGTRTVTVRAYDGIGRTGEESTTVTASNGADYPRPVVKNAHSHIRSVQLVYQASKTDLDSGFEFVMGEGADIVVSHPVHQPRIEDLDPDKPQLLYTNVSNIYYGKTGEDGSLLDWLIYAENNDLDREAAFFHVNQEVAFSVSATGGSTLPIDRFWKVWGYDSTTTEWENFTSPAANPSGGSEVVFPLGGGSVYLGYPEKHREINIDLDSVGDSNFAYVLEYPTAVDGNGKPTSWSTLSTISDNTGGLKTTTGAKTIVFDPPANWVRASVNGSGSLFYVRFRVTGGATPPEASTILARNYLNYVQSGGHFVGEYQAFDYSADTNGDGYLDDTEYASRASGLDARFAYEARVMTFYGQSRYLTNPLTADFQEWALDYAQRLLAAYPLADGLWYDNQHARLGVGGLNHLISNNELVETGVTQALFSAGFGDIFSEIYDAIAPHWVMMNTADHSAPSGGVSSTDDVIKAARTYFDEFAIRAMHWGWEYFERVLTYRDHNDALSPAPVISVIDTHHQGGENSADTALGKRTGMATLTAYYQLSNGTPTWSFSAETIPRLRTGVQTGSRPPLTTLGHL